MERTQDFALLRAAELAEQCRCNYFAVIKSDTSNADSTYTRSTIEQNQKVSRGDGSYSTTTTMTRDAYTISTRHVTITVVCFKEKPSGWATILDAKIVATSIKSKYGIQ